MIKFNPYLGVVYFVRGIFTSMETFDILIVGGGPIGLACGIEARNAGLSYVIVEKGCLVNSLYHYPINMTFFSTSDKLEIGNVPFMSLNAKPTRAEALEYYRRVVQLHQLELRLFETVNAIEELVEEAETPKAGLPNRFSVVTTKGSYQVANVILATGFYDIPIALNVEGESLPKVTHYYKDPGFYAFQNVVVAGANNSAVDAALECWRKGAKVTMVIRDPEIGKRVKYWARPDIINRIEEGSINAYFNSNIAAIYNDKVAINTPEGRVEVPNDWVLAMTGYRPNFELLKLWGIDIIDDENMHPVHNPETMESNRKGMYLAGVVCGGMDTHIWFIENSREHAIKIIKSILRKV